MPAHNDDDWLSSVLILPSKLTQVRFIINGIVATAMHYLTLVSLVEIVNVPAIGLANGLASIVGITFSYIGNHWFVFRSIDRHAKAFPRFLLVYSGVALLHASILFVWADFYQLNYTIGFIATTAISVAITFFANKLFVFSDAPKSK